MFFLEKYLGSHYPDTTFCEVVVDKEKCTGCKLCVQTCPGQLLIMEDGIPKTGGKVVDMGGGCMGCQNCVAICPHDAIKTKNYYKVHRGKFKTLLNEPSFPNPFDEKEAPPFDEIKDKITEVERVIYNRRSNRLYKKKKVPKALLHRIIEAGRFAPSAGNCQPWRFVVIQDNTLLKEIGKACVSILKIFPWFYGKKEKWRTVAVNIASQLIPNYMDQRMQGGTFVVTNLDYYDIFLNAPVLIIILGDERGIGEYLLDCGICAQNMVLTAHALGLGTCYIGFSTAINYIPSLKKRLDISWPYRVVTAIALGYPKSRTDKPVKREVPKVTWYE